jgi:AcrR family transcriptional regulator
MSIPYEQTGRTRQKSRTRRALVEGAREILGRGSVPTVEQAAETAGISRTTAYRYFPNQRTLLTAAYPEITARSLLGENPPEAVEERLEIAVRALGRMIVEGEPAYRAVLRLSLEEDSRREELVLRRGRAIGWIEDALEPLRGTLPKADLRRLVLAVRSATGIEALVWLTDIAGLSRAQAQDVMSWSAQAMLQAALSR